MHINADDLKLRINRDGEWLHTHRVQHSKITLKDDVAQLLGFRNDTVIENGKSMTSECAATPCSLYRSIHNLTRMVMLIFCKRMPLPKIQMKNTFQKNFKKSFTIHSKFTWLLPFRLISFIIRISTSVLSAHCCTFSYMEPIKGSALHTWNFISL